ncbi:hypothetical protein BDQ12DRAFT_724720 [Crucibulum laeve]|uniref:DNA replication regulator SLD2 n=1 Tax=Crucibulum laeve TaxID=68775 RepID=A0A5C3LVZ8_9AGAR|nr:hypothetical protein BDQ12DRAFT_724720 [Crucibulum laeve]
MQDLPTLRAQLKMWERSFNTLHGRNPTVDDIKRDPAIAEKYKLHKKLSKLSQLSASDVASSASKSKSSTSNPPSTPPHPSILPEARPSLLPAQSRTIETTAPLASFNPFSPHKKGKQKAAPGRPDPSVRSNPFASPSNSKHASRVFINRSPSLDPFPQVDHAINPSSLFSLALPPLPNSAVSRARKRLRGEPVSPSPNKDKRRRVTSQTTLPFPKFDLNASSDEEDEEGFEAANSSFVDDSPMKGVRETKSFKLLFGETITPMGDLSGINPSSSQSKAKQAAFTAEDHITSHHVASKVHRISSVKSGIPPSTAPKHKSTTSKRQASQGRIATKRQLSDTEMEVDEPSNRSPVMKQRMIPPSPAPTSTFSRNVNAKSKKTGKAAVTGRKRVKVVEADEDGSKSDDSEDILTRLKVIDRTKLRHIPAPPADTDNDDILAPDASSHLDYARSAAPRGHGPFNQDDGKFEVDLPDKLRRVLALQPLESRTRHSQAERMAKGLIYGQRVGHYDPRRGGEIWGVGEDDATVNGQQEEKVDTEGEDDWEGEPVPWEVGEL